MLIVQVLCNVSKYLIKFSFLKFLKLLWIMFLVLTVKILFLTQIGLNYRNLIAQQKNVSAMKNLSELLNWIYIALCKHLYSARFLFRT